MGKRNQESLSGRGAQGLSFFKMLLIDLIVIPPILYGAEFFLRSPGIPLGSKLLLCLMTATGTKIVFRIIERLRGKGDARPASYHHSGGIWMTNVGFAATLLIILIGGAALNTGTNLLYLMLSTLLSFWSISGAMSWVNMRGLEVARRLPSEVHANTPAEIGYDLRNKKRRLASYGLTLMDNAAGLEPERPSVNFLAILPGRKDRIPARVKFLRRGWAEFSAIHVISSFPFGFLEYSRRKPLPARILVYPELVPVERMLSRRAIELGMEDSPVKGHGSNLYSIRDYQAGDPAKFIHWKLSSKGTGIKVREFEREESKRIRLLFDHPLSQDPSKDELQAFERGISVTASFADYFIRMGFEVALWTRAGEIPVGSGAIHLRKILRALAIAETAPFQAQRGAIPSASENCMDVWISSRDAELSSMPISANKTPALALHFDPRTLNGQIAI